LLAVFCEEGFERRSQGKLRMSLHLGEPGEEPLNESEPIGDG
jgi:hypothetical protein